MQDNYPHPSSKHTHCIYNMFTRTKINTHTVVFNTSIHTYEYLCQQIHQRTHFKEQSTETPNKKQKISHDPYELYTPLSHLSLHSPTTLILHHPSAPFQYTYIHTHT